jgi:hypothetical protein
MTKALLYVHGNGGNRAEAERYRILCPSYDVYGIDFDDFTPWGTRGKLCSEFRNLNKRYDSVSITPDLTCYDVFLKAGENRERAYQGLLQAAALMVSMPCRRKSIKGLTLRRSLQKHRKLTQTPIKLRE